jgi:hypothetical protein
MKKSLIIGILTLFIGVLHVNASSKVDEQTGLIIAPGFEEVKTNCTVCHSAKFITLQRGDKASWLSMIRWMQKTQGLWEFDKPLEETILTYLATNYPPGKASRRPNLKHTALPPNPYEKP